MFIDQDNFEQIKQTIIEQIQLCEYLGFDLELTGIKGDYQDTYEELPFERYLKARKVSMKYNIIQFGLCIFIKNQNKYQAFPYTFYLFPQDLDDFIGLQVGAIFFNCEHGMDWNRWINKGIGYLNKSQFSKLQDDFNKDAQQMDQSEQKAQFQKILGEVKAQDKKTISELIDKLDQFNQSKDNQTLIETSNGYQRKIVYTYLEAYHKNMIGESLLKGEMKITKISNEEKQAKDEERQLQKANRFQNKIGFYQIWECVLNSKKPLIGHNCFIDIMFCYSHFVQCPPCSWEEFKEDISKNWPIIYDTKYIISFAQSLEKERAKLETNSSVENLVDFVKKNFAEIPIEVQIDQNQYHTAGFDAYMTGYIFLNLTKEFSKNELLGQRNKLYQFKSNYNINLNLAEDIKITQQNLMYIKLPDEEKRNQQQQQQFQKNQKQQFQKQLFENVVNVLKSSNFEIISSRIIHFKYIYLEFFKNYDQKLIQQKLSKIQDFSDCTIMNEKQYEKDRKEQKEREAKIEKFDRRF